MVPVTVSGAVAEQPFLIGVVRHDGGLDVVIADRGFRGGIGSGRIHLFVGIDGQMHIGIAGFLQCIVSFLTRPADK